jgi:hypothetical protein
MAVLSVKPVSQCKYDILSLGEIMIRLDPGDKPNTYRTHFSGVGGGRRAGIRRSRPCLTIAKVLSAGWNILVEVGINLGINLDKPTRARKVGNEFVG